jgi:hypothetical protein
MLRRSGRKITNETDESRRMMRPILWQQPVGEAINKATPTIGEAIQRQFRAIMRALTRPMVQPEPKPRQRRGGETTRGFMAAAGALLCRIIRPADFGSSWDTFTWLRIWDYNDPVCMHQYEHFLCGEQKFDERLFPQL